MLLGGFGGGAEEGVDVEAGEGGDVGAGAFAGLGFGWDLRCGDSVREGNGGRGWWEVRLTFFDVCGFYEFLELAFGFGEEFVGGVGVAC